MERLESQIAEWQAFVQRGPSVDGRDAEELETHLRDQVADLEATGLSEDEAFLVAVKRMGGLHELSREFAREHSGRLWKQLVLAGDDGAEPDTRWLEMLVVAVAAAIALQLARLLAGFPGDESSWLPRNLGLLVLPFLAGWFARRRELSVRQTLLAAVPFAVAALVVNLYPYGEASGTELLVVIHLPVALWFAVAFPYMGGDLNSHDRRMDFVRVTGEWLIYYALIALGGGVLMGLTGAIGDLGFTPNRAAALGLNLVLLVNLAGAAWLSARFPCGQGHVPRAGALADRLPAGLRPLGHGGCRGLPAAVRLTGPDTTLEAPVTDPHRRAHHAPDARPRGTRARWGVDVPGNVFAGPLVLGEDVAVVSVRGPGRAGTVRGLDLRDGTTRWEHVLDRGGSATPVPVQGHVVAAGEDGTLVALGPTDGQVRWRAEVGGPIEGPPLVLGDRIVLGIGLARQRQGSGAVVLVRDGNVAWRVETTAPIAAGPTLLDDETIVVATTQGTVHAVDLRTRELRDLVVPASSDHDAVDAPIVGAAVHAPIVALPDGFVVLASSGTVMAAGRDGRPWWSWSSGSAVHGSALACDGERVVVPGTDGRLLALDVETGERAWHVERLGRREPGVWSSPVVVGDTVAAVCSTGEIVLVGVQDGVEIAASTDVANEPVGVRLATDHVGRVLVATLGQAQRVVCWDLTG